jgi:hypothetical protein
MDATSACDAQQQGLLTFLSLSDPSVACHKQEQPAGEGPAMSTSKTFIGTSCSRKEKQMQQQPSSSFCADQGR